MTRPLPSVPTPNQSPSGAALSQLVRSFHAGPPVASYSASSTSRSVTSAVPGSMIVTVAVSGETAVISDGSGRRKLSVIVSRLS